jgi:Cu+-exporting ATPase
MTTYVYQIEGMTCAACVRRVEKTLLGVPGVATAQVNLATERATIEGQGFTEAVLAKALQDRGFSLVQKGAAPAPELELRSARWRMAAAWLLTLPLMAGMLPGLHLHLPWPLQAALSAGAAFGAGWPFLRRAAGQAWQREVSMDTLVAAGALVSWSFAIVESLAGSPHPPFETAAGLVAFLLVGKYLEVRARHRATGSVEALLRLAPARATRLAQGGTEEEISVAELVPGDRVRVRPGQAVPVDGSIESGQADLEESLLTGEPLPVSKEPGDLVLAGAIVHGGSLVIRVASTGGATWLARLAAQVEEAQASRAPAQALADRVSAVFVPVILGLAAATLVFWWLQSGTIAMAWRPAATVLVIACPCALGLATPVAMAAALGTAARQGLLVRDAGAMARLAEVTHLVLDKTGTLTQGAPSLVSVAPEPGSESGTLIRLAAALEQGSEHPLAKAFRAAAQGQTVPAVQDFRTFPGGGVAGTVAGQGLRLGSASFLGIELHCAVEAGTVVGMACGEQLLGTFVLADALRPEAAAVVQSLRIQGLQLQLLSGDRPEAAQAVARQLGLDAAEGGCTPAGKLERIRQLQAAGAVVAFVGDGVNDAPALAQADAGISLPGLDAIRAAARLNLLREGLVPLLEARKLALRTRRVVIQNLIWAFGYNLVLVPLAAANLLDRFGGPMLAGAAMGLSSLAVVLNAWRLRRS